MRDQRRDDREGDEAEGGDAGLPADCDEDAERDLGHAGK
jgi:hypothetical protein